DVIGPLLEALDPVGRGRAEGTLDRWAEEGDPWLGRAAILAPLRALRAGGADWNRFEKRAHTVGRGTPAAEAVTQVLNDLALRRPELVFRPATDR
ncbi:MAG: alkylation repair protein, partial [Glaciihabitans sp.]|nr:alkylation repair protein [Glaciihabitans sp.]